MVWEGEESFFGGRAGAWGGGYICQGEVYWVFEAAAYTLYIRVLSTTSSFAVSVSDIQDYHTHQPRPHRLFYPAKAYTKPIQQSQSHTTSAPHPASAQKPLSPPPHPHPPPYHHRNGSRRIQRCCVQVPLPHRYRIHAHHPSLLRPRRIQLDGTLGHARRHASQPRTIIADDDDANRPRRLMAADVLRLGMMDRSMLPQQRNACWAFPVFC